MICEVLLLVVQSSKPGVQTPLLFTFVLCKCLQDFLFRALQCRLTNFSHQAKHKNLDRIPLLKPYTWLIPFSRANITCLADGYIHPAELPLDIFATLAYQLIAW